MSECQDRPQNNHPDCKLPEKCGRIATYPRKLEICDPGLLELEGENFVILGKYCNKKRIVEGKDRSKEVVRSFELRGAATTTRYGGLVVRWLLSCPRVLRSMGMDVGAFGRRNCGKSSILINNRGEWPSKGMALQGNHRSEY